MRKIISVILLTLSCFWGISQTTVSKSWAGNQSIDNGNFNAPTVTFTAGVDFPTGSVITTITCSVTFSKVDNTCNSPGTGDPYNDEIRFQLRGPNSLPTPRRRMINYNDFTGTSNSGSVTMTFDGTTSLPANPTTGTYDANQQFSVYSQQSPFGAWRVRASDNFADDPLCFTGYTITITADWPLPVEYLSQSASRTKNSSISEIKWSTASEIKSWYYTIERSTKNNEWKTLDTILAAGNSNKIINYNYFDNNTPASDVYYRIRQVDTDGSFSFFNVMYVAETEESFPFGMKIIGNPVAENLKIQMNSLAFLDQIYLYNSKGKNINIVEIDNSDMKSRFKEFDVSHLNNGLYYVVAHSTTGKSISKKIIINNKSVIF